MKGCLVSHNLGANEGQVREAIRKFVYLAREFIIVLREGTLFVWFTAARVVSILEPEPVGRDSTTLCFSTGRNIMN